MAFRADEKKDKNKISIEMLKTEYDDIHEQARAFMVYYRFMKTKERAQKLMTLNMAFNRLKQNIELFKAQPMNNPATKFSYEVFRQTYQAFMPRWKKFVDMLMGLATD